MFKLSVLIILKCVSDFHDFVRKKSRCSRNNHGQAQWWFVSFEPRGTWSLISWLTVHLEKLLGWLGGSIFHSLVDSWVHEPRPKDLGLRSFRSASRGFRKCLATPTVCSSASSEDIRLWYHPLYRWYTQLYFKYNTYPLLWYCVV